MKKHKLKPIALLAAELVWAGLTQAQNLVVTLTNSGGRSGGSGVFYAQGFNGFYWTRTLDPSINNQPRYLGFYGNGSSIDMSQPAFGLPVRCIKD